VRWCCIPGGIAWNSLEADCGRTICNSGAECGSRKSGLVFAERWEISSVWVSREGAVHCARGGRGPLAVWAECDTREPIEWVVKIFWRPMVSCSRFHIPFASFLGSFYNMAVKWVLGAPDDAVPQLNLLCHRGTEGAETEVQHGCGDPKRLKPLVRFCGVLASG